MESVGGYAGIISNGNEILTDKYGVYMRIGYVYVVVIAAVALGSMLYGNVGCCSGLFGSKFSLLSCNNHFLKKL